MELKLVTSDNLNIADQLVTIDDKEFAVSGDTVQADGLAVGTHELKWFIQSDNGASFAATYNFEIIDRTAPEVIVSFSETNLYEGDDVTAEITATDAFGIKSITATFDGKAVAVEDNKVQLKALSAGEHVLSVDAVDHNGNGTVVETTFTVFKAQSSDTTPPQLTTNITVEEDNRIKITAEAEDEGDEVVVSGTVNGKKLTFSNNTAYYTPEGVGEYEIIISAVDAYGNAVDKKQVVTISEQIKEYELKLSVALDKNTVEPGEAVNATVKTNSLLGNVTFILGAIAKYTENAP